MDAFHDNLRNLGLDHRDVVNLRVGGITEPGRNRSRTTESKLQGLIRHIGLSNTTSKQLAEIRTITETVCVQNFYHVARRNGDAFIDLEIGDTHPSVGCVATLALVMTVLNGITIWVRKRRSSQTARRSPYPHPVSSEFELTLSFRENDRDGNVSTEPYTNERSRPTWAAD